MINVDYIEGAVGRERLATQFVLRGCYSFFSNAKQLVARGASLQWAYNDLLRNFGRISCAHHSQSAMKVVYAPTDVRTACTVSFH